MCGKNTMDDKQKERYIRWQNYRINQLSFSINLFLGFAVASLAFVINLKLENKVQDPRILVLVIKWWAASATLGCVSTVSRLLDFRYSAKKIREGGPFNTFMSKWLGPVTWGAFWGQVITYATGAYLFVVGVIST